MRRRPSESEHTKSSLVVAPPGSRSVTHYGQEDPTTSSPTTMPSDIAIAVIDDHDVIHAGIAIWCRQADPPIRIAGNYLSTESFLSDHPPESTDVDVVLVDLELKSRHVDLL